MGQSVANLANAAMRIYDKVVHEQVFTKNVLFNNILRNVGHSQGSTTKYISVHYGRNIGSAAGTESLTLPTAGNQTYEQANVTMKYNFHTITLTDVALQASKRSKEFLVNALESEYEGARNDMQRQLSRQGYGIGNGVIGLLNGTTGFDTPMVGRYVTDYVEVGSPVMFDTTTTTTTESSAIWTHIATITANDTFTATTTGSDNDYVFLAHSKGSSTAPDTSNKGREIMGLKGLIDDASNVTTLQGLSRSSYIWWNSYVNDNTTQRSLTDALLHTTYLEAMKKGSPKYALTSYDVYSAYGQLLSPDRRYTSDMKLNGGFTGLEFNGMPLVPDYDAPYDELYFIDPSVLSVEDLAPMSFLNEDGSILDRSSTTPAWNATLRYYANLAIKAPNKCSALRDVIK